MLRRWAHNSLLVLIEKLCVCVFLRVWDFTCKSVELCADLLVSSVAGLHVEYVCECENNYVLSLSFTCPSVLCLHGGLCIYLRSHLGECVQASTPCAQMYGMRCRWVICAAPDNKRVWLMHQEVQACKVYIYIYIYIIGGVSLYSFSWKHVYTLHPKVWYKIT
jgi:hypothetical protein